MIVLDVGKGKVNLLLDPQRFYKHGSVHVVFLFSINIHEQVLWHENLMAYQMCPRYWNSEQEVKLH